MSSMALCALLLGLLTLCSCDSRASQKEEDLGIASQKIATEYLETTQPFVSEYDHGWTSTVMYRGTGVMVVDVTSEKKNVETGQPFSTEVVVDVEKGVVLKATEEK
ncbi:MAG: hypothetical protein AB2L09_08950 [Coriobacteriia bacterium]